MGWFRSAKGLSAPRRVAGALGRGASTMALVSFAAMYFSALSFCSIVLGNSSSGIIEAASFGKYVLNLGDRQKGRERGSNVIDCSIQKNKILRFSFYYVVVVMIFFFISAEQKEFIYFQF